MNETQDVPSSPPSYYAISAQLQGGGQVSCEIQIDGVTISNGSASGGFNIASCEISSINGGWVNDNSSG